jgi:hypothetical protein
MVAHCHVQVREIAKEAAGHLYERLIGDSRYYEAWRRQNHAGPKELERRFVERNWPKCVAYARESLEEMLKRPDVPETTKTPITDLLAKDQSRAGPPEAPWVSEMAGASDGLFPSSKAFHAAGRGLATGKRSLPHGWCPDLCGGEAKTQSVR